MPTAEHAPEPTAAPPQPSTPRRPAERGAGLTLGVDRTSTLDRITEHLLVQAEAALADLDAMHLPEARESAEGDGAADASRRGALATIALAESLLEDARPRALAAPVSAARWRKARVLLDRAIARVDRASPPSARRRTLEGREIASLVASLELARALVGEGAERIRAVGAELEHSTSAAATEALEALAAEPLDRASRHVEHAAGIGARGGLPGLADERRIETTLDLLNGEIERLEAATGGAVDVEALDDRLVSAGTRIRTELALAPPRRRTRRPVARPAAASAGVLAHARAAIEACAKSVLRGDRDDAGELVIQLSYALQTLATRPPAEHRALRAEVLAIAGSLDDTLARLANDGAPELIGVYLMLTGLCHLAGVRPPPLPRVREPRPTQQQMASASLSIDRFGRSAAKLIEAQRTWSSENWELYLRYSAGSPALSWMPADVSSFCSNFVGSTITTLGEKFVKRGAKSAVVVGATAIGTMILPGLGTAAGFLLGVVIETIVGEIWGQLFDVDEAAAASYQMNDALAAARVACTNAALHAVAESDTLRGLMLERIGQASTASEVDAVIRWAEAEASLAETPFPKGDLSLGQAMLRDWLLEHADDENDGGKQVNETRWDDAKRFLGFGDDLDVVDLFVRQTVGHLHRLGVDRRDIDVAETEMRKRVFDDASESGAFRAATTQALADGLVIPLRHLDERRAGAIVAQDDLELTAEGVDAVRRGQLDARLALVLARDGATVYVDHWAYDVGFRDGTVGLDGWLNHATTNFEVEP